MDNEQKLEQIRLLNNKNIITSNMETKMKQDSEDRSLILKEVESNIDEHSKKIVEYDHKAKALALLEIKYNSLKRETTDTVKAYEEKVKKLEETKDNLENEVMILKRTIVNFKSKLKSIKSVMELIINDFGIEQVALASGLEKDKLKEYLQN